MQKIGRQILVRFFGDYMFRWVDGVRDVREWVEYENDVEFKEQVQARQNRDSYVNNFKHCRDQAKAFLVRKD